MAVTLKIVPSSQALEDLSSRYPGLRPGPVHLLLQLFQFVNELDRALEIHHAQWKLSRGRFLILITLYKSPDGSLSPSAIANQLDVTRGNMTGLIESLLAEKLVTKRQLERDRRGVTISLTKKGRQLIEKILPVHFRRISKVLEKLQPAEVDAALSAIAKIQEGLKYFREPGLED